MLFKNYTLLVLVLIGAISCKNNLDKFEYETSIASKVYEAQLKYFDLTILNYARTSKTGQFYFNESIYLDKKVTEFQSKIKSGGIITDEEKKLFFDHFEKTFRENNLIDFGILNQLKTFPIQTASDVDILKLYIKNNFVCILLNNKLIPFDSWSTIAAVDAGTIKNGQTFEVKLADVAWNSQQPNEWFLVRENKDSGLTKENIIDTLHQDSEGIVNFSTKHYNVGENRLIFISKLNTPTNERALSKVVVFYVK